MANRPTLGRIVLYRTDGRNNITYDLPAIIPCTRDSHPGNYPDGSENPLPVPESDWHCHLTVLTPGGFGTRVAPKGRSVRKANPRSEDFVGGRRLLPGSGSYVE